MKREIFLKKCGMGCVGMLSASWILSSCATTGFIPAAMIDGTFSIPISSFVKNESGSFKRYIVVKPDKADYPVVIYRRASDSFDAYLLRCTHQGTELNVYGDLISCTAHGSEFNNQGGVISGPASRELKSLPVKKIDQTLIVQFT